MRKVLLFVCLSSLFLFHNSFAVSRAKRWIVSPTVSYYSYASKRKISDEWMPTLAIDYGLTDRWGAQISWSHISTEYHAGNDRQISGWMGFINGVYYFKGKYKVEPYLLGGLGVINLRPRLNNDPNVEMNFNAGGGLAYFVSPKIGLRLDMRDVYTPNGGKNDWMGSFGVSFLF